MHFSKLFIMFSIFLLVQIINNLPLIHSKSLFSPYIFREYIGAEGKNITFSDVPINPNIEFHFILSFSIDYTDSNHSIPSNGEFNVYWDTQNLSPSHVLAIKAQHPNVKVAMSLGGDSISGNTDVVFSPVSVDSWLSNAIRSITKIVQEYNLDGIDIDYEHFNIAGPDTFAECIGRLVSYLKENGVISFSSIAPFDSDTIQQHYTKLWSKYGHVIDYVNFQFYAYDESTNVDEFLDHFNAQTSIYIGGKILVSFATDGSGGLSPRHGFFKACKILESEGKLVGIFIWSADDSKKANFHYEMKSQHFLVHGNVPHIN